MVTVAPFATASSTWPDTCKSTSKSVSACHIALPGCGPDAERALNRAAQQPSPSLADDAAVTLSIAEMCVCGSSNARSIRRLGAGSSGGQSRTCSTALWPMSGPRVVDGSKPPPCLNSPTFLVTASTKSSYMPSCTVHECYIQVVVYLRHVQDHTLTHRQALPLLLP